MVTTVTETIGVGKDYSTLGAWEAATDVNLVAADEIRVGVMYGQFDEILRMQSATVDGTRYRVLRGSEPYSPWDDEGPKINGRLILAEQHVRVENIGIELQVDAGVPVVNVSAANCRFDGVMAIDKLSNGQRVFDAKTFSTRFYSCIAVGLAGSEFGGAVGFYGSSSTAICDHCVAVNMGGTGGSTTIGYGFQLTNAGSICKNAIAIDNYTTDFVVSGTKTACLSSDGTGTVTGATLAATFVDASGHDFRALAGGPADGAGVAGVSDDFQNVAYASAYEVGAYSGTIVRTVYTSGIDSTISFGTCSINQQIDVSSIASTLAFGEPTIAAEQFIDVSSITSTLAFGGPTVSQSPSIGPLVPSSITSTLAFGGPTVSQSPSIGPLVPRGFAVPATFGIAAVSLSVQPAGIDSTLSFGTLTLSQQIELTALVSTLSFGTPALDAIFEFEEAANILRVLVSDALDIPVQHDNIEYAPSSTMWAHCSVDFVGARVIMVGGGNVYRRDGEITVEIFAPVGTGEGESIEKVDLVSAIADQNVDTVRIHSASAEAGEQKNGWWSVVVTIPFDFDSTIPLTEPTAGSVSTVEDIYSVLRQRADSALGIPIQHANVDFDPPATSWARFNVMASNQQRQSLSKRKIIGIAEMLITSPLGNGPSESIAYADRVVKHFLPAKHSGVTLRSPYVTSLGSFEGSWLLSVSCPFSAEI